MDNSDSRISFVSHHQAAACKPTFRSNSVRAALLKRLTLVAASAIASCVSELLHVTSKSSDEEKKKFLARVKCPSRDLPDSRTNVRLV